MGQVGGLMRSVYHSTGRRILFSGDFILKGGGNPRHPMERVLCDCNAGCSNCRGSRHVWVRQAVSDPFKGRTPDSAVRYATDMLSTWQFGFRDEADLQRHIHETLGENFGWPVRREVALTATERPDFMVGRIAFEVKVAGSTSALIRQLHRYAELPEVDGLVVVAGLLRLTNVPETLAGKPVGAVFVGSPF